MSQTIAPLYRVALPKGLNIKLGEDLILTDRPDWLRKDPFVKELAYTDKDTIASSTNALIADYEAHSLSSPDPQARGGVSQSVQEQKLESIMIANMALWIANPTPACFTIVLHALSWEVAGQAITPLHVGAFHNERPLYCHPDDAEKTLAVEDVNTAAGLYASLRSVPRNNPVWTALRVFWSALTTPLEDLRYTFFWIGLEALFGPEGNTGEITYKLAQRIAFFIAKTPDDARDTFRRAKKCYAIRSQIVHGRFTNKEIVELTGHTEAFVRSVVRRLAEDPKLMSVFLSNDRDAFLEDTVFTGIASSV